MKTRIFTIATVLMLAFSLTLSAKHVTKEDAAVVGKNYYWENCSKAQTLDYDQVALTWFATESLEGMPVYHVFNVNSNNGFIIVSADDNVRPVMGYSGTGSWTGDNIPPALQQLLGVYRNQVAETIMESIEGGKAIDEMWDRYRKSTPRAPESKAVSPLLTTTWDQGIYYNNQCPVDAGGPGGHAYAGCVAVSMAQVMYFYQHPTQGVGSNSYVHPVYGNISANFGSTTYNYAMMPVNLTTYNTQVAQLLFHCGVAVDMNYGPTGSAPMGTNWDTDIENALKNNFSFSSGLQWKWKNNYQYTTWISMLKSELDLGRPLIYYGWDGNPSGSAHNFNCDGYDDSNNFHFNWGWSGYYNGYYAITNLNPAPGYNYTYYQGAVFGMTPAQGSQANFDYGDAPDNPGYPTYASNNGACHVVPSSLNLFLGYLIDAESDGQPHVNCMGDDNNNLDDEDGVIFPHLSQGTTVNITVNAFGSGLLDAWMDFNQDGDWADAGEQIFTNKSLNNGTNMLSLPIPASAYVGWTYARFRYSTQGNLNYTGQAQDGEVEDYFIRIDEETQGTTTRDMLFSVDIGSDVELSDPVLDGDEALDPGDAYLSPGTYIPIPGSDGLMDDINGFGFDPLPDGGVPGTGAPCVSGMPIETLKYDFFDMDGLDLAMCDLRDYSFGEGMPPVEKFDDGFIHNADSLYISYDDDDFMPYPDPSGSIPRLGFSSAGMLWGQTQAQDEILEVNLDIVYPLSGQVMGMNPKYDEASIHPNLAPNPDINAPNPNEHDDDVDALDVPFNLDDVTYTYFSADHEAVSIDQNGNPLNPGSIYLAQGGQAFEVINAQTDIGLFPDTDIDAFEFTWIEYPNPDFNYLSLAMIFSVDEDDPTTPGDESGGMMPNALYVTWMTGWWFDLAPDGFEDDIDAITIVPVSCQNPKADFTPLNGMIYAGQSVVFTDISTGNPTNWSWSFNGGNPSNYNGSAPPAVVYNTPGSFPVSLTVSNACGTDTKSGTITVMPSNWQFTATNVSHIISVPLSASPTVNGTPLANGDLIGVFFTDFNGNEQCGGYAVWDGVNNISVMAYGDDGTTPHKDGFQNGELLKWKVFTANSGTSHNVSVTYDQTMPIYDGNYYDNGISALLSLNSLSTHSLNIFQGWSGISSYLQPVSTNLDTMMSPISNELIILRNFSGLYWPAAGINTLVNWDIYQGYVIKVNQDVTLPVSGSGLTNRTLSLTPGWHLIPMLSSQAKATASLFNVPGVMLVKEVAGPGVYWPSMGITTLNMMFPGKSYYVCVTAPVNISFPAKSAPAGHISQPESPVGTSPWPVVQPTPGTHLVAIPAHIASQFDQGDVIGAFTSKGLCAGYVEISGKSQVLAIYTDDPTTPETDGMIDGEQITYRLYDAATSEENILDVQSSGDAMNECNEFITNGISVMELKTGINHQMIVDMAKVFPNPASDYVMIKLNTDPESARLLLTDIIGNEIVSIETNSAEARLDVSHLAEGCYLLRISCDEQVVSKKIVIRK